MKFYSQWTVDQLTEQQHLNQFKVFHLNKQGRSVNLSSNSIIHSLSLNQVNFDVSQPNPSRDNVHSFFRYEVLQALRE